MMRLLTAVVFAACLLSIACGDPDEGAPGTSTPPGDATQICEEYRPCPTAETTPGTPVASPTLHAPAPTPTAIADPPTATVDPPPSGSGTLQGLVIIGPTCPVVREGEDCDDKPHEADIDIVDGSGATLMTVHSGADGRFTATLRAGAYTLVPRMTGRLPYAGPVEVTVVAGQTTEVVVNYDSGIR